MIRPVLLATTIMVMPALASAQGLEFDGSVTVGANFNSTDILGTSVTLNGYSFDFDGDVHFNESFSVGVGANMNTGNLEITGIGGDLNVDLMSFYLEPQYNFGNGGYAGAYLRMNDLDLGLLGPINIGIDTTSYGVFGGYDFGQGHVEVFYGMTDLDDPNGVLTTLDVTDFGISGAYEVMPNLEVFGSVMRTNIDITPITISATTYSVGAEYDLGNGFDIYGAVGGANLDLSDLGAPSDITAVGLTLGGSYDLSASGSLPVVLSAEYSRTNLDLDVLVPGLSPEIDRFALGVTIPIGNGSTTPLNSNTRTARGEYRSALESVLNSF